jgi:hypothetical protein
MTTLSSAAWVATLAPMTALFMVLMTALSSAAWGATLAPTTALASVASLTTAL